MRDLKKIMKRRWKTPHWSLDQRFKEYLLSLANAKIRREKKESLQSLVKKESVYDVSSFT